MFNRENTDLIFCLLGGGGIITNDFFLQYDIRKEFYRYMARILMHLQMQRDVCLDKVINLRQYILRYTVGNPTSLRNVALHWLMSEYMQLAAA